MLIVTIIFMLIDIIIFSIISATVTVRSPNVKSSSPFSSSWKWSSSRKDDPHPQMSDQKKKTCVFVRVSPSSFPVVVTVRPSAVSSWVELSDFIKCNSWKNQTNFTWKGSPSVNFMSVLFTLLSVLIVTLKWLKFVLISFHSCFQTFLSPPTFMWL